MHLNVFALLLKPLKMDSTVMIKLLKFDITAPITVALHYVMRRRYYMSPFEALENYPREKF